MSTERGLITGVNFSPGIIDPFRSLGQTGLSLDDVLGDQWAGYHEPVLVFVHLTCPRLTFTDRGKTALALGGDFDEEGNRIGNSEIGNAIIESVTKATASWAKARKAEERNRSSAARRRERLIRSSRVSVKDAAYEVMEEAYLAASANGTLPANARQVMYAARPKIQQATGKMLDDDYFTQTLLPNYIAEHGVNWNVVFDDRGHFTEPHTGREIGLGTLNVRDYIAGLEQPQVKDGGFASTSVLTHGPIGNYGAVLFVEKEGFLPLFEAVQLRERFDIAIMSTKGMSVTAARELAERLCGQTGVPLFILHDFDKSGLAITSTLARDTRRYQFKEVIRTIDLGLRLDDVTDLDVEGLAESAFDHGARDVRAENMRRNGATEEEIDFLLDHRIELNALTSDQLVAFVERKLIANRVRKIVPTADILAETYRSNIRTARIREIVDRTISEISIIDVPIPDHIAERVADLLQRNPTWRWDLAVREIARNPNSI